MKTSEFIRDYTHDFMQFHARRFRRVWSEVVELWREVLRLNWAGAREELGDVTHMFQLWLYTWGIDLPLWQWCARKFMARRSTWQALYDHVGIRARARECQNYTKLPKVIEHLGLFGVSKEQAVAAYKEVVLKNVD